MTIARLLRWASFGALPSAALLACQATGPHAGAGGAGGTAQELPPGGAAGAAGGAGRSSVIFDGQGIWARSEDLLGIRGVFFILEDSVSNGQPVVDGLVHTSLISDSFGDESAPPLSLFTEQTVRPCVSGTLAMVTLGDGSACDPVHDECAWDSIWGGGIGMHLKQSGESSSPPEPWDASAYGVRGIEFSTTGDIGRATLRFKAKDSIHPNEDFCVLTTMGEDRRIEFAELKHQCWESEGSLSLDSKQLTELQWQIVPDSESTHPITNFCVRRVALF